MIRSLAFRLSLHLISVMCLVLLLAGYMHANDVGLPLVVTLSLIIIMTLSCLFVQVYISTPFKTLTTAMRRLESGHADVRLSINGSREISELSDSFNLMVVRIFKLIDDTALHKAHLVQVEERLKHHEEIRSLNSELSSRLAMIEQLLVQREHSFTGSISALVSAVEASDPYTHGHSERVTRYSLLLADRIGLSRARRHVLEKAGLLHDIGKIGVEKSILHKQGRLTATEMAAMQRHPEIGMTILRHISHLDEVRTCVGQHHERYDGMGYPAGLNEDKLLIESRILAVVDTFDAITSDRPYRKGRPVEFAIRELQAHAGTQFDPYLVKVFVDIVNEGLLDREPVTLSSGIVHAHSTAAPEFLLEAA